MSRFETSKFVRNSSVMNIDCLIQACDSLGWKYELSPNELRVTDIGIGHSFGGEYALMLKDGKVTYNTYYLQKAKEYVKTLQEKYEELSVVYSKNTIVNEFKNKGFSFLANEKFVPSSNEVSSFYMVGRSKDKNETEPVGKIKFTILSDGTVISDSNYLPDDVNKRAHEAMDSVDFNFSSKRVMTRKEIPSKYHHKFTKEKILQHLTNQK